jgi:hypothetical protein
VTFLPQHRWNEVRQHFTEEEKVALRNAATGEVLFPRGAVIDAEKLEPHLRAKVNLLFSNPKAHGAGG